jgi:long-chain acyl-CoA synthetase
MGIVHYLLKNVELFPDKTAIIFADTSLSYREITEQTRRLSYALSDVGVGKGTRICILLNNSTEFVTTMLAVADLGATIVPMSSTTSSNAILTAISAGNIEYIIGWHAALKDFFDRSQEKLPLSRQHCISVGREIDGCLSFDEILKAAPETYELGKRMIDDETDFILTMTSGSTSDPKPIVFTQGTKIRRSLGAQELYDITDKDITLVATPLYHSISQRLVLLPIITGGTSVIMQKFTSKNWFTQIDRHKVTFSIAVSSQLEMILRELRDAEADLRSLRCIVCCCSLLKNDIKSRLIKEMRCDFHECYGASEVGTVSNLSPETSLEKLHTVGKAVPGVEVKIVDDKRSPVAIGEIGEIACKSTMRFSRYYNNKQATQQSMEGGFFYTGDMGYLDGDGYLVFSGRKKEIIITGGTNVYPMDIEAILNTHPKVKECAVIGVEDKRFGEAVVAFIISVEGEELSSRELQRYCLHRLVDYQQPLAYVFVDDFPRTELGKVLKQRLVNQYSGYDLTAGLRNVLRDNE